MGGLYNKLLCVATSASLLFGAYGCKNKKVPSQDANPPGVEAPYNQTARLAKRVLDLGKRLFPKYQETGFRGAVCIGPDTQGAERYAVIYSPCNALEVGIYSNLKPELEAKVNEHLCRLDYGSAVDSLIAGSNLRRIEFWDLNSDGFRTEDTHDKIESLNEYKLLFIKVDELSRMNELEAVNEKYKSILETIIPILEEELRQKEGRQQAIMEKDINSLMSNFTNFGF